MEFFSQRYIGNGSILNTDAADLMLINETYIHEDATESRKSIRTSTNKDWVYMLLCDNM